MPNPTHLGATFMGGAYARLLHGYAILGTLEKNKSSGVNCCLIHWYD